MVRIKLQWLQIFSLIGLCIFSCPEGNKLPPFSRVLRTTCTSVSRYVSPRKKKPFLSVRKGFVRWEPLVLQSSPIVSVFDWVVVLSTLVSALFPAHTASLALPAMPGSPEIVPAILLLPVAKLLLREYCSVSTVVSDAVFLEHDSLHLCSETYHWHSILLRLLNCL